MSDYSGNWSLGSIIHAAQTAVQKVVAFIVHTVPAAVKAVATAIARAILPGSSRGSSVGAAAAVNTAQTRSSGTATPAKRPGSGGSPILGAMPGTATVQGTPLTSIGSTRPLPNAPAEPGYVEFSGSLCNRICGKIGFSIDGNGVHITAGYSLGVEFGGAISVSGGPGNVQRGASAETSCSYLYAGGGMSSNGSNSNVFGTVNLIPAEFGCSAGPNYTIF